MRLPLTLLLASIVTAGASSPASADGYGPDEFGYTAVDNYCTTPTDQQFNLPAGLDVYEDISNVPGASPILGDPCAMCRLPSGTCENLNETDCQAQGGTMGPETSDDEVSSSVFLGFFMPVYGQPHNTVRVSSNGFISFSSFTGADLSNDCPLPQPVTGGGSRICALHDDLVSIVHSLQESAVPHPDGTDHPALIIQWDADHFPAFTYEPFTVQAFLYDTGDVMLLYRPGNDEAGFGSTTGIQNDDGTIGLTVHCNTAGTIHGEGFSCVDGPAEPYAIFIKPYVDCNNNYVDDAIDISSGSSQDLNANGIPDECDDCDEDGVADVLEIVNDPTLDCNGNLLLDSCEIADGVLADCDGNGRPDVCQIDVNSPAKGGPFFCVANCDPDCNDNGIPDACDPDCDANGIPDDCDTEPENDPETAPNTDDCADALLVDPEYTYVGNTFGATNDGEPQCTVYFGMNDVWYRYRPAWNGSVFVHVEAVVDLGDEPKPIVISLHDGCPGSAGNQLDCSATMPNFFIAPVTKGEEYWLRIAGRNFDPAAYRINLLGPATATNLNDFNRNRIPDICECLADVNDDGVVDAEDFAIVMAAYGPCAGCPEDVDGSGVVDDHDAQEVLMNLGPCPFP
jgi:hypothetical protein